MRFKNFYYDEDGKLIGINNEYDNLWDGFKNVELRIHEPDPETQIAETGATLEDTKFLFGILAIVYIALIVVAIAFLFFVRF